MRIAQLGLWVVAVAMAAVSTSPALAAERATKAPKAPRVDVGKRFDAVEADQKAIQDQIKGLQDQIRDLSEHLLNLADEQRKEREAEANQVDAGKQTHDELRELVRGLYVETSGLKADVAQAREDVQTVNGSMESFRLSSGILIAVVILLEVILAALALRGGRA